MLSGYYVYKQPITIDITSTGSVEVPYNEGLYTELKKGSKPIYLNFIVKLGENITISKLNVLALPTRLNVEGSYLDAYHSLISIAISDGTILQEVVICAIEDTIQVQSFNIYQG